MLNTELKNNINKLWDKFWSRGLSNPMDAIEQISYLLFIRRLEELDNEKLENSKSSKEKYISIFDGNYKFVSRDRDGGKDEVIKKADFKWSSFTQKKDEELLTFVRDKVFNFIKNLNRPDQPFAQHMQNANLEIKSATLLEEAIEDIDKLYEEVDKQKKKGQHFQDTLGDIYEYLLEKLNEGGRLGQFRTPRHIIQMMCEILNPNIGDVVCDPACGTSGFLVGAYQHILSKYTSNEFKETDENGFNRGIKGDKISKEDWKNLKEKTFFGFDNSQNMVRIGLMNLILHDITIPQIEHIDTLSKKFETTKNKEKYTKILANPPFAAKVSKTDMSDTFRITQTNSELLFIDRIIQMLKPEGKAAVIIPEGVLYNSGKGYKTIREALLKDCMLDAVISLPSGVFKPYTGVKTSILFFTKKQLMSSQFHTRKVWFYELESDGYSLDDNRRKLKENPLPGVVKSWEKSPSDSTENRKRHHFYVPLSEIREQGFDLSINRYKDFDYEIEEYEPPKELLDKLIESEELILNEMRKLKGLL